MKLLHLLHELLFLDFYLGKKILLFDFLLIHCCYFHVYFLLRVDELLQEICDSE